MIKNFDEQAYLDANLDVKQAILNGDFPSVEIYLEQFGLERIKNGSTQFHHDFKPFDEVLYLKEFPEVYEAVEYKTFGSAFEHFCQFGYAEIVTGARLWRTIEDSTLYKTEKEIIDSVTPEIEIEKNNFWDENMELFMDIEDVDKQDTLEDLSEQLQATVKNDSNDLHDVYSFIPFSTSKLPKGPTLIFAPHPDDETFGMGGSILHMTENGTLVNIVMMTDGSVGGNEEVRKEELRHAMKILGVNEIYFFGAPDQGLVDSAANIYKIIQLLKKHKPINIFFPSPLEYHPDHRTTAWLVWNALQSIAYRGNVFSYEIANQSPVNALVDITSYMDRKTEAMKCYASQQEQLDYIGTVTSMNQLRAYTVPRSVQYVEAFYHFKDLESDLMSYYYAHFHKYHKNLRSQKSPLVSVLIRTKNRPELLQNALSSVQMQSYQNLEVNIVNDAGERIEHIVDRFDFERCFIKNNIESKGRAGAANDLLKMANGQYVIFLDDDDTFDNDHIENLVKVMLKNHGILASYSAVRVGEGLHEKKVYNHPYNAALLRRGNYIPFHAVLFSSKLIENGCRFDESFLIYEDWDFWLQVSEYTEFYYLNKISATYHINGTSGSGGASENSANDMEQDHFKRMVYEKWSKVWSSKQLEETFTALAQLRP